MHQNKYHANSSSMMNAEKVITVDSSTTYVETTKKATVTSITTVNSDMPRNEILQKDQNKLKQTNNSD